MNNSKVALFDILQTTVLWPSDQDNRSEPVLSQRRDLLDQPLDFYEPDVLPATQFPTILQQISEEEENSWIQMTESRSFQKSNKLFLVTRKKFLKIHSHLFIARQHTAADA